MVNLHVFSQNRRRQFSFSDLFHEGLHDGTASNAQNHELVRSRPVAMLKLNIIVTLNMLETNFATLHTKNTIVIKIEKWQIVLIEGLSRVAVRRIDHQQLLTEVVISKKHTQRSVEKSKPSFLS